MKRFFILFGLIWMVTFVSFAQIPLDRSLLYEFIRTKNSNFYNQYNFAKKYLEHNNMLQDTLVNECNPKQLIRFIGDYPLYYHSHNLSEGTYVGVDMFYDSSDWHDEIYGQHQLIGIWDLGHVFADHLEFIEDDLSRVHIDETTHYANHSTHVGGTIIAKGFTSEAEGMAPEAELYSFDFYNDIAEMALAADKKSIILSNHSYGPVAGWSFNSSEDIWYWYGVPTMDSDEDYKFGFYGEISADIDLLCSFLPYYSIVISAGNDLKEGPENQPVTHKIWDGKWRNSNVVRDLDGGSDGFDCIGMNGVAKNVITVGSVRIEDDVVLETSFSSCGPTDDGRIKPDVVAPGTAVFSSLADSVDAYAYYSGTSMSAAVVTGGIAQLNELQYQFQPGVNLLASSVKALLIHSAKNINGNAGPDFKSGWGMVDFESAHKLLENNILSGGGIITEECILSSDVYTKIVSVREGSDLKVTLVWTDLPGNADAGELNNPVSKLINDLDLYVMKEDEVFYPFVLFPESPESPAEKGVNVRDNVEQVLIENCESGEYRICVDASKLDSVSQYYSLIISGPDYDIGYLPPTNVNGFYAVDGVKIFWNSPEKSEADEYEIYCNSKTIGTSTDTFFIDDRYKLYDTLHYFVRALYNGDEDKHSVFSNELSLKALPVFDASYQEDFEEESLNWQYLDTEMGWRYGNAMLLSSEYMDFSGNDSWFMGINSDNLGRGVHVSDLLVSPPLHLDNGKQMHIEFRYYMNNEAFDTHDSLALYYRTLINQDWALVKYLKSEESWTEFSELIQFEDNVDVVQLSLFFDDNSEWGNGAGFDDFSLEKTYVNDIQDNGSEIKFYVCNGMVYYKGLNTEQGLINWYLVDCRGKKIANGNTFIESGCTSFNLPQMVTGIYFVVLQTENRLLVKKVLVRS